MSSFRARHTRLIAANIAALFVLAFVTLVVSGPTHAQSGGGGGGATGRSRGVYTLVSGRANGMSEHVVWLVDAANRELVALKWDRNRERFEPLGYRNIADDAAAQKRAR